MSTPLVSVLMTAYNREEYIAEAIESVLASTFKDFELIIVDDCSTDGSHDIGLAYAKKDVRVRAYRNEKNLGQFQNRNRAASLASGKYLKYLDSDDLIYPHGLEVMVWCMEHFPEAGLGVSEHFRKDMIYPTLLNPRAAWQQGLLGGGLFSRAPGSTIIRRDAFEQIGGFHYVDAISGDTLFLHEASARWPVVVMPAGLYFYRVHRVQASRGQTVDVMMLEMVKYIAGLIESPECPLSDEERNMAYKNLLTSFTRHCLRCALRGHWLRAWNLWRASGRSWADWRFVMARHSLPFKPKPYFEA
ncbi:MAG TPA: glycosyltransferase family 2 protein [Terriglobales bacterium]|nr:glycosyltransferase family 2 protein [Terriglobales bacterium]